MTHRLRSLYLLLASHLNRVEIESFALIILVLFSPWWTIDRTLPWQKIWGDNVSWASRYEIIKEIDERQSNAISIVIDDKEVDTLTPSEIGVTYNAEELMRSLYSDANPVKKISSSVSNIDIVPVVVYDETLQQYVESLSKPQYVAPVNASIRFDESNTPILFEATEGRKLDETAIKEEIVQSISQAKKSVQIRTEKIQPEIRSEDLQSKIDKLQSLQKNGQFIVTVEDKKYTIPSEVIITLLDLDTVNVPEELSLSREKVAKYVSTSIAPYIARSGIPEKIVVLDGATTQTIPGTNGVVLDEATLVENILTSFNKGDMSASGKTISASAGTVLDKRYSKSSIGLQYLLSDWDAETSGDWGVYVQDISDSSLSASLNPNKKFVTASIYKLFLAEYVYSQLDAGTVSRTDATALSKSVGECMRVMIVVSDNSCPSYFFDRFGYGTIQQYVQNAGYGDTNLNNSAGGDKTTTAKDTIELLKNLEDSKHISVGSFQELSGYMGTQIYRSGIPKGVSTSKSVQNKVGFLYGYNHDAGYVRGASSYRLVILSNGSNYKAIAELSKRIDQVMSK